jgi:GGDEF domain-containing protein
MRIGTQLSLQKINYENQELIRQLDFLFCNDPLTRILNLKDIFGKLKYAKRKFRHHRKNLSIILDDIEGFKKIMKSLVMTGMVTN